MLPLFLTVVLPSSSSVPAAYNLEAYLPEAKERRRYEVTLRRLSMGPVSPTKLAAHANLTHRLDAVRVALQEDPRYERVPGRARERYALRAAHRHAARLAGSVAA